MADEDVTQEPSPRKTKEEPEGDLPPVLPEWLRSATVLTILLIALIAMGTATYLILHNTDFVGPRSFFLIFLISFSFMSVSCLIFTVRARIENFRFGSKAALSLAGSAAAWVVVFLITTWAYQLWFQPFKGINLFDELLSYRKKEEVKDWIPYVDWRDTKLPPGSRDSYRPDEDKSIGRVLASTANINHHPIPDYASVDLAYFYVDDTLQFAIRRCSSSDLVANDVDNYMEAFPSGPQSKIQFVTFSWPDHSKRATPIPNENYVRLHPTLGKTDCFSFVQFIDPVPFGDFLICQTKLYAKVSARIRVGIFVSDELSIGRHPAWRIKSTRYPGAAEIPLYFEPASSESVEATESFKNDIDEVLSAVPKGALSILLPDAKKRPLRDSPLSEYVKQCKASGATMEHLELLEQIQRAIQTNDLHSLLNLKCADYFEERNAQDPIFLSYDWVRPTKS